jgi:hypothetical protein
VKLPKFGLSLFPRICKAVDLPIPFMPTKPKIWPGRGVGNRWSLNEFLPNRCVHSFYIFLGMLIILIALNGHFLTHRPHPIHSIYEIYAMTDVLSTSIQIF